MSMLRQTRELTLWDLAEVVCDEVEQVFDEERIVREVCNLVLQHLISTCVKNVELR